MHKAPINIFTMRGVGLGGGGGGGGLTLGRDNFEKLGSNFPPTSRNFVLHAKFQDCLSSVSGE